LVANGFLHALLATTAGEGLILVVMAGEGPILVVMLGEGPILVVMAGEGPPSTPCANSLQMARMARLRLPSRLRTAEPDPLRQLNITPKARLTYAPIARA
jgi:hypothetical protein